MRSWGWGDGVLESRDTEHELALNPGSSESLNSSHELQNIHGHASRYRQVSQNIFSRLVEEPDMMGLDHIDCQSKSRTIIEMRVLSLSHTLNHKQNHKPYYIKTI